MEYIDAQVLVDAVIHETVLEKSRQRRSRKHRVRQNIQRRFQLGPHDALMQELVTPVTKLRQDGPRTLVRLEDHGTHRAAGGTGEGWLCSSPFRSVWQVGT